MRCCSRRRILTIFAGTVFSFAFIALFIFPSLNDIINNQQIRLKIEAYKLKEHNSDDEPDYKVDEFLLVEKLKSELDKLRPEQRDGCQHSKTLAESERSHGRRPLSGNTTRGKFYNEFGDCDVYRETSDTVEKLLLEMNQLPIIYAKVKNGGSQTKLILRLANGAHALFKPQRFPDLNQETLPDHFYYFDYERSFSEIATFHLDRLLGFRRSMPTVGRVLDLNQIKNISDDFLKSTFFISPDQNICYVGKCTYYCDTSHAICGTPNLIRGSVQVYLPPPKYVPINVQRSFYSRTYSKVKPLARFQRNDSYCNKVVKNDPKYNSGRRLLDLVDTHIMDFFIGNLDRHHIEEINIFGHYVYPVHTDNGRGFGKASEDYLDILAPLYQCCIIRPTTLSVLLQLSSGPTSFGQMFKKSLSKDPTFPVLAEQHYSSLDRRMTIVLKHVLKCIENTDNVIRNSYAALEV